MVLLWNMAIPVHKCPLMQTHSFEILFYLTLLENMIVGYWFLIYFATWKKKKKKNQTRSRSKQNEIQNKKNLVKFS